MGGSIGNSGQVSKVKVSLDDALNELDEELTADLKRARARKRLAEIKRETKDIQEGKKPITEEDADMDNSTKRVEDAAAVAAEAAGAGLNPADAKDLGTGKKRVIVVRPGEKEGRRWTVINGKPLEDPEGEYDSFAQAYKVAALESGSKNDITTLLKFLKDEGLLGNKSDDFRTKFVDVMIQKALNPPASGEGDIIKEMRTELAGLKQDLRDSNDPIAIAQKFRALTSSLTEAGFTPQGSNTGRSVEELKEANRHVEEKMRIEADSELKKTKGEVLSSLPERIGVGLAEHFFTGETGQKPVPKQESLSFICTHKDDKGVACGMPIPVPPGAKQVICPKCGTPYGEVASEVASNV